MPKLKSMKFGREAFGECIEATFENLPELRSIKFGIDSFKFNKGCCECDELIMRNLPKLETCKVVSWMSSTFVYPCNATMENIPSANDVELSPEAFKNICDFTLKSIQSTV
ncbi:hypothetical protein BLSTO_06043 [Blastocystis sp. subtype 1]